MQLAEYQNIEKITKQGKVLISELEIQRRISQLADQITADLKGHDIVMISILKGAFVFTADMARSLNSNGLYFDIDFIKASSYGSNTTSVGEVRISLWHNLNVVNRTVLLVDDIVDSGYTCSYVREKLLAEGAANVKTCVLLDKPKARKIDFKPDYAGFEVPNMFVVGYGLDFDEKWRHLPYIAELLMSEF